MKVSQLKIHDIVGASLPSGYYAHFRVHRIGKGFIVARRCLGVDGRETVKEYIIQEKKIEKLLRRRNGRGFDIPVV